MTEAYEFAGTSETVTRIGTGSPIESLVDQSGARLATRQSASVAWLLPDPHGSVAGGATGTSLSAALRYAGYGQLIARHPTSLPDRAARFTYQGRLDIAPAGLGTPLLEMGARFYSPGLGSFSQADTVIGSALDPVSLNRYLYAHANPTSLIDPTGRTAQPACDTAKYDFCNRYSIPVGSQPNGNAKERYNPPPGGGSSAKVKPKTKAGGAKPPARIERPAAKEAGGPSASRNALEPPGSLLVPDGASTVCHPRNPYRDRFCDPASAMGQISADQVAAGIGVTVLVIGGVLVCIAACPAIAAGAGAAGAALAAGQGLVAAGTILCIRACTAIGSVATYGTDVACGCLTGGETGPRLPATSRNPYGPAAKPVRIEGPWPRSDIYRGLQGMPPRSLGSPDLHHADQMPGSPIHEVVPTLHRGNRSLHQNRWNQGVTDEMRKADKELHWWYRAQEMGAWDSFDPTVIYSNWPGRPDG